MNAVVVFDYGTLESDLADKLRSQAERIRLRIKQHTVDLIETGRDLQAAKTAVGHGDFTRWVETELQLPMRTAQGYMKAAAWADDDGKNANFALLQPTTIQRLGAKGCPKQVREKVLDLVAGGQPVADKEVLSMIRERRKQEDEEAKEAALPQTTKDRRQKRQERIDRETAERHRKAEEAKAAVDMASTELAALLFRHLPGDSWSRTKELLAIDGVAGNSWHPNGKVFIQFVRIIRDMDALGIPADKKEKPATTDLDARLDKVIDRFGIQAVVAEFNRRTNTSQSPAVPLKAAA